MPQTLNNGIIVPINSDAWNLTTDLQTMGNSARVITYVADIAARDAITPLAAGRPVYVASEKRLHIWDGAAWAIHNGRERSSTITLFSTGYTPLTGAHEPRVFSSGNICWLMGAVQHSSTSGNNVLTVPSDFRPPSTGTRFLGEVITSLNTPTMLLMSNGVVQIPTSGYGDLNLSKTSSQVLPLTGFWVMD